MPGAVQTLTLSISFRAAGREEGADPDVETGLAR